MILDRLNQPAGRLMRPCPVVETFASVSNAAEKMTSAGLPILPIVRDGRFIGVLTQAGILASFDAAPGSQVGDFARDWLSIPPYVTGAEAMRKLEAAGGVLVVVAEDGEVCGMITAASFLASEIERPKPPIVGGMATPFGVYLTTGAVSAGKKGWNLVATGAFLFCLYLSGQVSGTWLAQFAPEKHWLGAVLGLTPFATLILAFRAFPISGYHAAEHQVVHAIEQDEQLTIESVRRMPRVHPRCGTNLTAALSIFAGTWEYIPFEDHYLKHLSAVIVTLLLWRPVGSAVQQYVTTKPATDEQIQSGISAAEELLAAYSVAKVRRPTAHGRLVQSGVLHVIAGSFLAYLVASLIALPFGVPFLGL